MPRRADPKFPRTGWWAWRLAVPPARRVLGWWFPVEHFGPHPPSAPIVVAANHFSHLDPVLVGMAIGQPLRYLAVDELYGRSRFFDRLTLWLGAIPMSRTSVPVGAIRTALGHLRAGGSIGVFPEARRVWTWDEAPLKRGAAWLSLKSGAPLVPLAIAGTEEAMGRGATGISRTPIQTMVGEPIYPADHVAAEDPVGSMVAAWQTQMDVALRSLYRR